MPAVETYVAAYLTCPCWQWAVLLAHEHTLQHACPIDYYAAKHSKLIANMGLTDMFRKYADSASHHTGLHYVPSFNDLNTNSNDDVEENEMAAPTAPVTQSSSAPTGPRILSNKMDPDWPQFQGADLHKVNVANHTRNARHTYDIPTGSDRGPSVWEHIIKSEKLRGTTFKSLDQDNDGKVTDQDFFRKLKVTKSDAKRMLDEADRNKDGVVTEDEYRDVLSHYGSE